MTKAKKRPDPARTENLAKALSGLKDGTYSSARQAAIVTGVSITTIYYRLRGGQSRRDANVNSQALAPAEESALVKWAETAAAIGHPPKHTLLRELAEEIRKVRIQREGGVLPSPLGKDWVTRFSSTLSLK